MAHEHEGKTATETWNKHLAHPFKWSYTGKGKRNIIWLEREPDQLDLKFLKIQLQLLQNLLRDYRKEVPQVLWAKLMQIIEIKTPVIEGLLVEDSEALQQFADFKTMLIVSI